MMWNGTPSAVRYPGSTCAGKPGCFWSRLTATSSKLHRRAALQRQQHVEQRVRVLAAGQADHHAVALTDHRVVRDRLAHEPAQARLQAAARCWRAGRLVSVANRCAAPTATRKLRPAHYCSEVLAFGVAQPWRRRQRLARGVLDEFLRARRSRRRRARSHAASRTVRRTARPRSARRALGSSVRRLSYSCAAMNAPSAYDGK